MCNNQTPVDKVLYARPEQGLRTHTQFNNILTVWVFTMTQAINITVINFYEAVCVINF